jgi:hypothetical protein
MGKNLYVLFFTIRDIDNMIFWKHLKKKKTEKLIDFSRDLYEPTFSRTQVGSIV